MKNLLLLASMIFISSFAMANDDYEIKLKSGTFTPAITTDFEKAIEPIFQEKSQKAVYRLIQFFSIPTEKDKQAIHNAGIVLLNYIPNKAFFCQINENASSAKFKNLNIRSILKLESTRKLAPNLSQDNFPEWAMNGDFIQLNIKYFSKEEREIVIKSINEKDGQVISELEIINTLSIQIPSENIEAIAQIPAVQWIEPIASVGIPDDTKGRSSSRSNVLNSKYAGGRKYDGTGVSVALADVGRVGPHIDFAGRLTNHTTTKTGNHSDMTSGIFVGAGNLDPSVEGMAPGADMNIYRVNPIIALGIRSYPHISDAVANLNTTGAVITSTSYSQGEGGVYTADCEFVDQQIDEYQVFMHVFSAGNSGTRDHGYGAGAGWGNISGGTKAGKNVICVGNIGADGNIFQTSSRGPAADGRIKPDICAKGEGHRSTDENNDYQNGSGTSAATPLIAGIITQLHQAYKIKNGGDQPESALLKASILNTATDVENPGPDFKSGWGTVNALKAVRIIEDERYIRESISQGDNLSHTISVPDNVAQLRVMTYWSDAAGSPSAAKSLVNDINMQIADPSGAIYDPWVLDPTPNAANLNAPTVRGTDNLNNMEQVTIDAPAAGDYTVNLNGFEIPQGPQVYYVVYDFIYDGVELVYPVGGEGFVTGETEIIMWDASEGTDNFTLEYSLDGGVSYNLITNSIAGTERQYAWRIPPLAAGNVKVRVSRGASQSESIETFAIAPLPANFEVASVCPDVTTLTWDSSVGADMYEISMLGEKYMDSIGVTDATSFEITGLNVNEEQWFSIRTIIDGDKGRRVIAIKKESGTKNCILDNDIGIAEIVFPSGGIVSNCQDLVNTNFTVSVNNFGQLDASDIEIGYQINGGNVVSESLSGIITAGESINYTFSEKPLLAIPGQYDISIWANYGTDENYFNDTLNTTIEVVVGASVTSFPHMETFESFSTCSTSPTCEAISCELEQGWINYENLKDDDIDWRTDTGGTGTSNTGPSTDYDTGTSAGQYLYLEGTEGCNFREAMMISPCIDLTNIACAELSFAYHMFGANIGELHVDMLTKNGIIEDVVAPIIGAQGDQWNLLSVDLTPYAGDVINARIRGSIGNGTRSDIAVDAFSVQTESAPIADFSFSETADGIVFTNSSTGNINSYLWDFGDGNSSTDSDPTHEYTSTGTFDVTLIIESNCGRDSITQTIGFSDVNIIDFANAIEISPNPNNGNFSIEFSSHIAKENLRIKIVDVVGREILDLGNIVNQSTLQVEASSLANGVYLIKIEGEGFKTTKRMVKQ